MRLLSGKSEGEVEDNREKWGDIWEKLMAIIRNNVFQKEKGVGVHIKIYWYARLQ
jgi:septation ring formation regulator EzrA